jgi:YebC/PmpR family DNA-binding regulatory protein
MGRAFENRKMSMFARWDRMAKAFARVGKDIAIAVKASGPNPESNPALRRAIQNGRAVNMPRERIENAIKRALGNDMADYQELIYEGYAPHGAAIVVETATDNPTRTVANVRMHFNKGGGNLGAAGSVAFMFRRRGLFKLKADGLDLDTLELELIDHGLEDLERGQDENGQAIVTLRCSFNDFGSLQAAIESRGITPLSAQSAYVPETEVELSDDQMNDVLALIDRLEQDEDVQHVYHNVA